MLSKGIEKYNFAMWNVYVYMGLHLSYFIRMVAIINGYECILFAGDTEFITRIKESAYLIGVFFQQASRPIRTIKGNKTSTLIRSGGWSGGGVATLNTLSPPPVICLDRINIFTYQVHTNLCW